MRISLLLMILSLVWACDDGDADTPPAVDMGADAAGGGGGEGGGDPDMGPRARPEIEARPVALQLVAPIGETAMAEIAIRNGGMDPLIIDQVVLEPVDALFTFVAPAMTVAPGESTTISVSFTPMEERERRVDLIIRSNDREQGTLTIPITGRAERDCYRVMPRQIQMGTVPLGMQSGRFGVSLSNCGDIPIDVTDVFVAGDPGFTLEGPMGMDATGLLEAGAVRNVSIFFANEELGPDQVGQAQMVVLSDSSEDPEVRIDITVRGSGAPGCQPRFETDQLDFGQVRIGTEALLDIEVVNQGTAECDVRDITVEKVSGPVQNTLRLVEGLEGGTLAAGASATFTVGFMPAAVDPIGDRGELNFDYRDELRMENRRVTVALTGVGSEAAVGGIPAVVNAGLVTVPGCASWERGTAATNVGFVSLCFTGYSLEGEDCGAFVLLEEPEIPEDGCIPLEREEGVPFDFVFQPDRLGDHECVLIIQSDAMNIQRLPVPIRGTGTDTAETIDMFTVGRLNAMQPAVFRLSRPVDNASVVVTEGGEVREGYDVSEVGNSIIFPRGMHPARDAELVVTYQAVCLERR